MKEVKYVITDPLGMHARPAGLLVKEAAKCACKVTISVGGDGDHHGLRRSG